MEKRCWIYAWQMMLTLLQKASKSESKGSQEVMKSTQKCIKKKEAKTYVEKCVEKHAKTQRTRLPNPP